MNPWDIVGWFVVAWLGLAVLWFLVALVLFIAAEIRLVHRRKNLAKDLDHV